MVAVADAAAAAIDSLAAVQDPLALLSVIYTYGMSQSRNLDWGDCGGDAADGSCDGADASAAAAIDSLAAAQGLPALVAAAALLEEVLPAVAPALSPGGAAASLRSASRIYAQVQLPRKHPKLQDQQFKIKVNMMIKSKFIFAPRSLESQNCNVPTVSSDWSISFSSTYKNEQSVWGFCYHALHILMPELLLHCLSSSHQPGSMHMLLPMQLPV